MITEATKSTMRRDEALYVLAQAGPSLDAASLDSVVRRYPEHATELTEIAIELALEALHGADDDDVPASAAETNDAVLQAMSHFHNRLYAVLAALVIKLNGPVHRAVVGQRQGSHAPVGRCLDQVVYF